MACIWNRRSTLIFLHLVLYTDMASSISNVQLQCTSESKCRCLQTKKGTIVADCAKLNLTYVPSFWKNVTIINIQFNKIQKFPENGELPVNLTYLDMSHNALSEFNNDPLANLTELQYLDFQDNQLQYTDEVYQKEIFRNLRKLKYLNIKQNNHQTEQNNNGSFPVAIGTIISLQELLADGLDGAQYPPEFKALTNLTVLDVSGISGKCKLSLIGEAYFRNLPSLTHLNLSGCDIRQIHKGALKPLHKLRHLNISNNERLTFSVLSNISYDLQFTDISVADVSKLHCTYGTSTSLYISDVQYLNNTNLKSLYVDSNRLAVIQEYLAYYIPETLEHLSLRDNALTMGLYVFQSHVLKGLKSFDGSLQNFPHNPESNTNAYQYCYDWRGPPSNLVEDQISAREKRFPLVTDNVRFFTTRNSSRNALISTESDNVPFTEKVLSYTISNQTESEKDANGQEELDGNRNGVSDFFLDIQLPPNIEMVRFEKGLLRDKIPILQFSKNALKRVYLSGNILYVWQGPMLNLDNVEILDLSNNLCSYVSSEFFESMVNIKLLNVSHNLLGFVLNGDLQGKPFRSLGNLINLDLSYNRIASLPKFIFDNQTKLEYLNLSYDLLGQWTVKIEHMQNLALLDLSYNQLTVLSDEARHEIDAISDQSNLTINLIGNRLECSCENQQFVKWLYEKRHLFHDFEKCSCRLSQLNGKIRNFTNIKDILVKLEKACSNYFGLAVGMSVAVFLSIVAVIAGIVYRYRWKLRYLYYMTKNRYKGYSPVQETCSRGDYLYDAFISYAEEERQFVTRSMIENLETNHSLKLCIHSRDFLPGVEIASNITNAIHNSRKTVVILSRNYLKSYWCKYELNMARMESIHSRDGDDVLFLVFYDNIPARELPLTLLDLINSNSYIEYPHDEQGNLVFWENLAIGMSL